MSVTSNMHIAGKITIFRRRIVPHAEGSQRAASPEKRLINQIVSRRSTILSVHKWSMKKSIMA